MAEIISNNGGNGNDHLKKRAKKHSTHIDMTPMVDLMSLLITFFMLTTAFSKPKIMEIVLPEQSTGKIDDIEIPAYRTVNILITGNDKLYYYIGVPPKNDNELLTVQAKLIKTNYGKDGIRKMFMKRNMELFEKVESARQNLLSGKTDISQDSLLNLIKYFKKQDKKGPIVMIKADEYAKYKNVVDIVDEMAICNVARYSIVDMNVYEKKLLQTLDR
jgi:biopolymer transport protein ExbD